MEIIGDMMKIISEMMNILLIAFLKLPTDASGLGGHNTPTC